METQERRVFAVVVDNEPGVLARVVGLFSGRGYNIASLTVSEIDHSSARSRITIVTSGTPMVLEQIKAQLDRLVPVHAVADLTKPKRRADYGYVERELLLVKVVASGDQRVECLRLADAFRARPVDATKDSFIFEVTGKPDKIDAFIDLMRGLGDVEVSRTGSAAISRGAETLSRSDPALAG
ncbi:MAG: acetolactate synthase small subunit [Pseudomonadota bacterium]